MKSPPVKDNGNGHVPQQEKGTSADRPADSSVDALIEEAQALKDMLCEAHGRAGRHSLVGRVSIEVSGFSVVHWVVSLVLLSVANDLLLTRSVQPDRPAPRISTSCRTV